MSIDGGGIKGIFPAAVLSEFEKEFLGGRSCGTCFDLITGTSTGGIIALGLANGLAASQILDMYISKGAKIFPPPCGPFQRMQRWLKVAKHSAHYLYERQPLEDALRTIFGTKIFGESQQRLCIPAFDGVYNEVQVFKTPHHPDFRKDWQEEVVTVALATAAAPTYFPVFANKGRLFADGGVWANNPIMIGLVDALTCYELDRRSVEILSLSCGDVDVPFKEDQLKAGGLWHWREIITAAMHLQSQNVVGQAGLLIGRDQLVRIGPDEPEARIDMDDYVAATARLPSAAAQKASAARDQVAHFFSQSALPFRAFYGPREALE